MAVEKVFKVSVCVVTYNHEKYIRQCLQSIVDQETDFDFEVIVGDDCSTDNTRAIVQEFAQRYPEIVKPVFHEYNIGVLQNYRIVHSTATGEYVAHMDGDDYWLQNKLQSQLRFLELHSECVAVYANAIVVDENDNLSGMFNNTQPEIFDINYLLKKGNFLNHSSMMYSSRHKASILAIIGNFIDYRVHLRLAMIGQIGYINSALVAYRRLATSMVAIDSDLVREWYFESLKDCFHKQEYLSSLRSSICYFISSIVCSKLLQRKCEGTYAWYIKIKREAPFNVWLLVFCGISIACVRVTLSTIRRIADYISGTQRLLILFKR